MKKIILPLLFLSFASLTFAQSLRKVNKYLEGGDIANAKSEVDAYVEKKPDDGEGIYLKAKIYTIIADSTELHSLVDGDARAIAFDYFKQAVADSNNMKTKLAVTKDNYQPIFNMYSGYFMEAVKAFNKAAQTQAEEDFTKAMDNFILANHVGQYIGKNEWASIGKVDTTLVLNIAKAALNAKKNDTALKYFAELADAKISGPVDGEHESFKLPYEWLELHYKQKGDKEKMLKYAKLGNEVYPKESYFNFVLIDYFREQKETEKVLNLFDEIVTEHPDSLSYRFRFANEIFGYLYNTEPDKVVKDKAKWLSVLKKQLDEGLTLDPNDVNTNWLLAQYHYNLGIELRDSAIKNKDPETKMELNKQAKERWNKAIPYGAKALEMLGANGTKKDKSRYKSIANLMQNIYQSLGDKENLKKYQEMYDNADKKLGSGS